MRGDERRGKRRGGEADMMDDMLFWTLVYLSIDCFLQLLSLKPLLLLILLLQHL